MMDPVGAALQKWQLSSAVYKLVFEDINSEKFLNLISHEVPEKMSAIQIFVFDIKHLKHEDF